VRAQIAQTIVVDQYAEQHRKRRHADRESGLNGGIGHLFLIVTQVRQTDCFSPVKV